MAKIHIGTIRLIDLEKRIRKPLPPSQRVVGTPKGKKGYNRQKAKREMARNQE